MKELYVKIKESLLSALPITLIVYVLALTPWFELSRTELVTFSISAAMLIVGLVMFLTGVNMYQFLSNNRYMRGDNHDNQ